MELHDVVKNKKAQQNKNIEIYPQKEDLKIIIENWKIKKKIEILIDAVQKKNEFFRREQ